MSVQVADLFADLSLRTSSFTSELNKALGRVRSAGGTISSSLASGSSEALEQMQEDIKKTQKQLKSLTWSFRSGFKDMGRVASGIVMAQAFYRVLGAIQECTSAVIDFDAEVQTATVSFEILLNSAVEAKKFIYALEAFAEETPFTFEDSEIGARRLMAVGFSAKSVIPLMRGIADGVAVAGSGTDGLERVARAIGQIKTKGRLMGEEMRQLHEAMIPAAQILRDELGLTADQVARIGDLQIPADKAILALMTGIEKRYGGAADKLENTTRGLMNKMHDRALFIGQALFKIPLDGLKSALTKITDTMGSSLEATRKGGIKGFVGSLFSPGTTAGIMSMLRAMQMLFYAVKELWAATKPLREAFGSAFTVVIGVAAQAIAALLLIVSKLVRAILTSVPYVKYLYTAIAMLVVANMAYKAILLLKGAIMSLSIAATVSKAIDILTASIIRLTIAMIKNPILAAVALVITALLYLIATSERASLWMDRLSRQIANFLGLNANAFSAAADNTDYSDAIEEYNKALEETLKGTEGVGDEAEKSGKKIKDGFIASFDEVFQVPDKLDDASDGFENFGANIGSNMPPTMDLPEITMDGAGEGPDIGPIPPIIIPSPRLPDLQPLRDWCSELARKLQEYLWYIDNFGKAWSPSTFPLRDFNPVINLDGITDWRNEFDVFKDKLLQDLKDISGWFKDNMESAGKSIGDWYGKVRDSVAPAIDALENDLVSAWGTAAAAAATAANSISGWFGRIGEAAGEAAISVSGWFGRQFKAIPKTIESAFQQAVVAIKESVSRVGEAFNSIPTSVKVAAVLAVSILIAIFTGGLSALIELLLGLGPAFAGAMAAIIVVITSFFVDAKEVVAAETSETITGVKSQWDEFKLWIQTLLGSIGTSFSNGWVSIKTYATESVAEVKDTLTKTWTDISTSTSTAWTTIKNSIILSMQSVSSKLGTIWSSLYNNTGSVWGNIKNSLRGHINGIIAMINRFIQYWNNLKFSVPTVNVPLLGKQGGWTVPMPRVSQIPLLASGGIVRKDTIARVGEAGKREAVVPLTDRALAPFAELIAAKMDNSETVVREQPAPIVYVGTLIADDKGLAELERRMKLVRVSETKRSLGGVG